LDASEVPNEVRFRLISFFKIKISVLGIAIFRLQAQKALGKSGRILGGSIMIGVSICNDPQIVGNGGDVGDESQLNQSSRPVTYLNQSTVADASVTTLNSSLGGARLNNSIRPLAQAYKSSSGENKIADTSLAAKSGGSIVGKAMEYIFGW